MEQRSTSQPNHVSTYLLSKMEQRLLEVTILSAKDLNNVNFKDFMCVYIIISISSDKLRQRVRTPVAKGDNPCWNFETEFIIDETAAHQNIFFSLKCERYFGDKDIGEVRIPIKELLQSPEANAGTKLIGNYQVRKPDGKFKGSIKLAYQFEKKVEMAEELESTMHGVGSSSWNPPSAPMYLVPEGGYPLPLHPEGEYPPSKHSQEGHSEGDPPPPKHSEGGYPPLHTYSEGGYYQYYPPPSHAGGYPLPPPNSGGYLPPPSHYHAPPPPQGGYPHTPQYAGYYGYAYPPPYGGYPPPLPPGYGYPPPQHTPAPAAQKQNKKNSKDGPDSGAGLLRGALRGLMIGNAISGGGFGDVG